MNAHPPTLTVHSIDELLAYLPHSLGFHPRRAVVVAAMRGRQLLCTAHIALDDCRAVRDEAPATTALDGAACRAAASQLLTVLRRHGVTDVHIVGYEDIPGESQRLLETIERLGRPHVVVSSLAVVRGGRRWMPLSGDVRERVDGVDIQPHPQSPAIVAGVVSGSAPLPDRAQVRARVAEDPVVSGAVAAALDQVEALAQARGGGRRVPRGGALWRRLLVPTDPIDGSHEQWPELSAHDHARLLRSLSDVQWRDGVIAWAAPGSLPMTALPRPIRRTLHRHLDGPPADPRAILARLEALARHAPSTHPSQVAPICTVVGCVAWHLGDGGVARDAHERALDADPGYRLALLGLRVIELGVRPQRPQRGQGMGPVGRLAV